MKLAKLAVIKAVAVQQAWTVLHRETRVTVVPLPVTLIVLDTAPTLRAVRNS